MEIEDSRFIAGIYSTAKDKEETTLKKAFSLFLTIAIVFPLQHAIKTKTRGNQLLRRQKVLQQIQRLLNRPAKRSRK